MGISEQVDQAILQTPAHQIRDRVDALEQEWSDSRWVEAHAAAVGLLTLGAARFLNPRVALVPSTLGKLLLAHAVQGFYPLLPVFHWLGARPRAEIDRQRYGLEQRLHPRDPVHLNNSGRRHGDRFDRVRRRTAPEVNQAIDLKIEASLEKMRGAAPIDIRARLAELEKEWDIDQVIQSKTAALVNLGLALGGRNRRGYMLAGLGFASLLSHALTGWSPPLPILRRLGFRTRREIDREKFALLAML
ncbi:MAG: hypothetical protein KF760_10225 [Candidatus Eremiobacteraeota bacterium]|nr:hypothetical protein [Candidatus Eremiobacteraeota bacterium]MCW5867692.1 hypothetical protein [Candidatus Eremiobacteraeota bacterium]